MDTPSATSDRMTQRAFLIVFLPPWLSSEPALWPRFGLGTNSVVHNPCHTRITPVVGKELSKPVSGSAARTW